MTLERRANTTYLRIRNIDVIQEFCKLVEIHVTAVVIINNGYQLFQVYVRNRDFHSIEICGQCRHSFEGKLVVHVGCLRFTRRPSRLSCLCYISTIIVFHVLPVVPIVTVVLT